MNLSKCIIAIPIRHQPPESHCLICTLSRMKHFHLICHSLYFNLLTCPSLVISYRGSSHAFEFSFTQVSFEHERGMSDL